MRYLSRLKELQMKFKKVELHAFRAYKDKANGTFDFTLDGEKIANFVSIYAPNGFGKTSFYDGIEWAITNRIVRLDGYAKEADAERKHIKQVKGSGEKQTILKNMGVGEGVNAYVKLWTNNNFEFERTVDSIKRIGGKDYYLKTPPENIYFTSVILSQDGIDSFLKASSDEERYDKFINYFGDKGIEKYHESIVKLENKNKQEKAELDKKINEIKKILQEPISNKIFEFTNEKINEFNKTGQHLELIKNDFDEIKKLQFEEKLAEQKIELTGKIDYYKAMAEKLPSWVENSEKYFEYKAKWEKANLELKDYEELHKASSEIRFLNENIQKTKNKKSELGYLRQIFPSYKSILSDIGVKENELKKIKAKIEEYEKSFSQISHELSELSKKIELTEYNKKQLVDLLENSPKTYQEIKEIEYKLKDGKTRLESQQKLFDDYQAEIKLLNDAKGKFELTIESIKNNIFIDVDSDEKYQLLVKNITEYENANSSKLESLKSIYTKQEEYKKYNEQVKNLLSLGVSLIDENQTDTCPLCNTKQDSYEILKDKVLNNPLLNSIERELLEQSEQLNYEIKINNKNIEDTKSLIIFDFDKKLQEIKTKLTKLEYEIKKINLESLAKEVQGQESSLVLLHSKIEHKAEESFKSSKVEEIKSLEVRLVEYYDKKKQLEDSGRAQKGAMEISKVSVINMEKEIALLKQKEEYRLIYEVALSFEQEIDIEKVLNESIESLTLSIKKNIDELEALNERSTALTKKYNIVNIDEIVRTIEELKDKIFDIYAKEIMIFESSYEQYFKHKIDNHEMVKKDISEKHTQIEKDLAVHIKNIEIIETLEKSATNLLKYIEGKNKEKELEAFKKDLESKAKVAKLIADEKKKLEEKINKDVESFFHEELINQIYSKIDPHPEFKKVKFKCSFENGIGKLNVFVTDDTNNKHISPSLYYSTAQLNVLSLSIFLAKALNAKDDKGNNVNCIFIDDPIQSMDSINILATIDLFRSLVANYDKQIILSTHDENFHQLLKKKIPKEYFDSRFIELETFGTVKKENSHI